MKSFELTNLNKLPVKKIILMKPNGQYIGNLTHFCKSSNLNLSLGGIHELTFEMVKGINKNGETKKNPYLKSILPNYRIELTYGDNIKELFIPTNDTRQEGDSGNYSYSFKSLPQTLQNYKIKNWIGIWKDFTPSDPDPSTKSVQTIFAENDLQEQIDKDIENAMNQNAEDVPNDYTGDYLKDGILPEEVINDLLTNYAPHWSLKYMDPELKDKARSYDFQDSNLLDSLADIYQKVNGLPVYDSFKKTISLYSQKNTGNNTGLFISERKYLKSIEQDLNIENVITRLHCYGADGISINSVNPIGTDYIEDFTYYMNGFEQDSQGNVISHSAWMSDELVLALIAYQDKLKNVNSNFKELVISRNKLIEQQNTIQIQQAELVAKLKAAEQVYDARQTSESRDEQSVIIARNKMNEIKKDVDSVNSQLEDISSQISEIDKQVEDIKKDISKENNFSKELLDELFEFVIEDTFSDDGYTDPQSLFEDAYTKIFIDKSAPIETITIGLVDLFNILDKPTIWKKIKIGDKFILNFERFDIRKEFQIMEMQINMDSDGSGNGVTVTISNTESLYRNSDQAVELMKRLIGTASSVESNKNSWNQIHDTTNEVTKLKNSNLNSAKNAVNSGYDQTVTVDHRGITVAASEDSKKILRMTNGVIGLSEDGWETVATAITAMGITAEQLIGNILIGNKLVIMSGEDNGQSYIMDKDGFQIKNSSFYLKDDRASGAFTNGIEISPENGLVVTRGDNITRGIFNATDGITFQKNIAGTWTNVLYFDSQSGDLSIKGSIDATSFNIKGQDALTADGKIKANIIDGDVDSSIKLSWATLKVASGYTASTPPPQYAKNGNITYLRGKIKKNTSTTSMAALAATTYRGIDVSHYQNTITWSSVASDPSNIKFAIIKATEGSNLSDDKFMINFNGAKNNNITPHIYHYFVANSSNAATSEAEYCANIIDKTSNFNGYVFLDVEDPSLTSNVTNLTTYCNAWFSQMKKRGYKKLGIYASRSFYLNRLNYKSLPSDLLIWIAAWGGSDAGITCDVWQYTSSGSVNGITGRVDMDISYTNLLVNNPTPDPSDGRITTLPVTSRPTGRQSFYLYPGVGVNVNTDGSITPENYQSGELDLSGMILYS